MELLSVGLLSPQTTACPWCFLREVPIRLLSVRAPVREPIQPHSQTENYQEEEGFPCPFLKTEKSALILEKKGPDCVHLWAKLSIQNVVSKCFSARLHFIVFMTKCLSKYLSSTKPPLQWKTSGWARALRHTFAKRSVLNVWRCSGNLPQ